jgi:hypothetical protein
MYKPIRVNKDQIRSSVKTYLENNGKVSFYNPEGELIRRLAPNKFKGKH